MKMSKTLYAQFAKEIFKAINEYEKAEPGFINNKRKNIKYTQCQFTSFAWWCYYQTKGDLINPINAEKLEDSHIETAVKSILKSYKDADNLPTQSEKPTSSKYGKIVDRLKTQMANTDDKWAMPWDCGIVQPTNAKTEHKYTATNRLILGLDAMLKGKQAIYATFNQWKELDCKVKKGAKSTPILMPLTRKKEIEHDNGETETKHFTSGFKILNVFHYSDVDGYTPPTPNKTNTFTDFDKAEHFVARTGAIIKENTKAYYSPTLDYIAMPPKTAFMNTQGTTAEQHYYSTLLHELTHWTGATHRLNRAMTGDSKTKKYAFEELVAELGAVFASQDLGLIKQPRPDHAKYLNHWLAMLNDSPDMFFKASTQAEKAVNYLHTAPTEHPPPIKAVAFNSATQASLFNKCEYKPSPKGLGKG